MADFKVISDEIDVLISSRLPTIQFDSRNSPAYVISEQLKHLAFLYETERDYQRSQLLATTATGNRLYDLGLTLSGIIPLPGSQAFGKAVIQGNDGEVIPYNTRFTINNNLYYNINANIIGSYNTSIVSATFANNFVTINSYPAKHGLATGTKITVSGCVPSQYNGTDLTITVIDPYKFQYPKTGISTSPATTPGIFTVVYALLDLASVESGQDKNLSNGSILDITVPLDNVNEQIYVTIDGVTGGRDNLEPESAFRQRLLNSIMNYRGDDNDDYWETKTFEASSEITRVKILSNTPRIGTFTILFMMDNRSTPTPTQADITAVKNYIGQRPYFNIDYIYVNAPTSIYYDIDIVDLSPDTTAMRDVVLSVVTSYFLSLDIGEEPSEAILRQKILTTQNIVGQFIDTVDVILTPSASFNNSCIAIKNSISYS
jgi:uncharacterized phage protein gp47/JayE